MVQVVSCWRAAGDEGAQDPGNDIMVGDHKPSATNPKPFRGQCGDPFRTSPNNHVRISVVRIRS